MRMPKITSSSPRTRTTIRTSLERDPEYWQSDHPDEEDVMGMGAPGRIFNTPLTIPEEGLKIKKKAEE